MGRNKAVFIDFFLIFRTGEMEGDMLEMKNVGPPVACVAVYHSDINCSGLIIMFQMAAWTLKPIL